MGKRCIVCGHEYQKGGGRSFHRFPDDKRRQSWLEALQLKDENVQQWTYICMDHFKNTDFIVRKSGVRNLKLTAVPFKPKTTICNIEERFIAIPSPKRYDYESSSTLTASEHGDSLELYSNPGSNMYEGVRAEPRYPVTTLNIHKNIPDKDGSSRTVTATDLSGTLTATDSSGTLTATDSSCTLTATDLSGTLTATDSSGTLTATELEENSSGHLRPSCQERKPRKQKYYDASASLDVENAIPKGSTSSSTITGTGSSITLTATEVAENSCNSLRRSSEEKEPPQKKRKTTRRRFIGDFTSEDFNTPQKAKKAFNVAKAKIIAQKRRIDAMRKQNARFRARISSLTSLLRFLKQNNYISESAGESIEASLPNGPAREVVTRILKGSRGEKYSAELRAFALTLHFYSPRAYKYVRDKFNKSLPHPSTISKWYQNIDGSPGFTKEALTALRNKVEANKKYGKEVFGNLVMDEMSIRKKTEWVGNKFCGGIDIGARLDGDTVPEAKEVIVFLVTSINGHWKVPVGYFFIDGLSGGEKANLVNSCLRLLHDTGIIIPSLTFDGAASNISMAKQLGVDFSNPINLKTFFNHPITQDKVYVFLDICHMMKLVRNCLGDMKCLKIKDGNVIQWKYLEDLVNIQDEEGLNAATKIKKRHMQYVREKMRVKIATQTFSKSVCDALTYLEKDLKLEKFQGAEETATFCELFNDLFDILNSRNLFSNYKYKRALSSTTEEDFFNRFSTAKQYILNLTLNDRSILQTNRKTGFLGFLVGMQSFKGIYTDYVKENKRLSFLLGYKFSQDHLEIFFSSVRSSHGFNNNPTARQFQSSFKKLLIAREVRGADTANAVALDNTLILNVSSRKITLTDDNEDLEKSKEYKDLCLELNDHDFFSSSGWHLSNYIQDVVIYIAGFVVKSLKKCITCAKCMSLLESNETYSLLQRRKTYGKLCRPSKFVSDLCTWGEKSMRLVEAKSGIFSAKYKNILNLLISNTIRSLPAQILQISGDHIFDGELLDNHQLSLIKLILKRYFVIRIHHETRKRSDQVSNRVRSMFTHLILYQNQ